MLHGIIGWVLVERVQRNIVFSEYVLWIKSQKLQNLSHFLFMLQKLQVPMSKVTLSWIPDCRLCTIRGCNTKFLFVLGTLWWYEIYNIFAKYVSVNNKQKKFRKAILKLDIFRIYIFHFFPQLIYIHKGRVSDAEQKPERWFLFLQSRSVPQITLLFIIPELQG